MHEVTETYSDKWGEILTKQLSLRYVWTHGEWPHVSVRKVMCTGKGKGSCFESRLHDNACSTDFTFPLARWVPMQPATIDPTLDLRTRYPLRLGGPRQCGIRSLPDTSTHGQHWESNPRPLILSPMPFPLDHMLPCVYFITPVPRPQAKTAISTFLSVHDHTIVSNKELQIISDRGFELLFLAYRYMHQ